MRRTLAAVVTLLAILVATAVSAQPARAGLFEGDVQNLIPASSGLTVHIASFYDTDGFTVAEASFEVRAGAAAVTLGRGTFFKIEGTASVVCRYIGGRAICYL